jgi:hypothetical protein
VGALLAGLGFEITYAVQTYQQSQASLSQANNQFNQAEANFNKVVSSLKGEPGPSSAPTSQEAAAVGNSSIVILNALSTYWQNYIKATKAPQSLWFGLGSPGQISWNNMSFSSAEIPSWIGNCSLTLQGVLKAGTGDQGRVIVIGSTGSKTSFSYQLFAHYADSSSCDIDSYTSH